MPLTKDTPMKTFIDDFVKSDDPKFAGKSKAKRIEMAKAAWFAKQKEKLGEAKKLELVMTPDGYAAVSKKVKKVVNKLTKEDLEEEMQEIKDEVEKLDEIGDTGNSSVAYQKAHYGDNAVMPDRDVVKKYFKKSKERVDAEKKEVKEEAEELDEISKKTLGSYINKATQDVSDNAYTAGSVHNDLSKTGNSTHEKTTAQEEKRKAGIKKAVTRLTKEEAEELDEKSSEKQSDHVIDIINNIKASDAPTKEKHLAYLKDVLPQEDYEHIERLLKTESVEEACEYILTKKDQATKAYVAKKVADAKAAAAKKKDVKEEVELTKVESFFEAISTDKLSVATDLLQEIFGEKVSKKLMELKEAIARRNSANPYHETYRSALEAAYKHAADKGFDVHEEDQSTTHVDPRPHKDETRRLHFRLLKDGKEHKKQLHVQVYNRGNDAPASKYEVNHYIA